MKTGDITYIAILRGINVSGQKIIRMDDLQRLFGSFGFRDVSTYIQSGNVVFRTPETKNEMLLKRITGGILSAFGFSVPVIIRTASQLETIIAENPFLKEKDILADKLHVTFLSEVPAAELKKKLETLEFGNDRFVLAEKEIWLYCPGGYGNTKLSNGFFETKLKVTATTRNWNTVKKLLELSREQDYNR